MPRNIYIKLAGGAAVVLLVIIILAVRLGSSRDTTEAAATDIAAGRQYLQQLEAQDPAAVDKELKRLRQERLNELCQERLRQLEAGEVSVWTLFDDSVILGDSRAVGFWYFDFLPESQVLAEAGATILNLEEHIPELGKINPSTLFLCYGLNDVSIGIWSTPEEYAQQYADIVGEIREVLPDVQIYISSILPARDPAFEQSSAWYDIPQYSAAVEEMCKANSCHYVNNDALAEEYADLWEVDGVHVQREFYPHWAANLISAVYRAELEANDPDFADTKEED